MNYELSNGKEITIGRESHTGLLQFLLDEEGGRLPNILSGKFTSQKFVDEAYRQYRAKTPDLRTGHPLNETAFDEVVTVEKKERPKLKYKNPKVSKKDN
jgi:hypothetical protein